MLGRSSVRGSSVPIHLASRRRTVASLTVEFLGAQIIDATSKAMEPWVRLSPFYPHGGIPVPSCEGVTAQSVEGIWQALKVFEHADIDPAKLQVTTMRGLKRTARRYGPVQGHRAALIQQYIEGSPSDQRSASSSAR